MLLEEPGQADALAAEQLRGEHGVEEALCPEFAAVVQEPQVEVAAVHHQVLVRQERPQGIEVDGREHVHQVHVTGHEELQKAHPDPVVEHVVRLGIQGDLVDLGNGLQKRLQLTRLVDHYEARGADGGLDAEKALYRMRQKTGNHLKNVRGA